MLIVLIPCANLASLFRNKYHTMQPLLLILLIIIHIILHCHCLSARVPSRNTLNQGDSLNSTSQLVSANEYFTLGFYTPRNTNNTYLAVQNLNSSFWFTVGPDWPYPVWIGNRDKPIHRNSNPILTIDDAGNLIINHTGGEPVRVYSSGGGRNNISATLLDSGNFVVSEMKSSILWESFDYPTDTLMPGMKLGTNKRTGRNWTITSWFNETNPATGAFTMEWDPIVAQLLIRRRGVPYWMSGEMKGFIVPRSDNYSYAVKGFQNFKRPSIRLFNFNFTKVTNGSDEYLLFSLVTRSDGFNVDLDNVAGMRLNYDGDINDTLRGPLLIHPISNCHGYKTKRSRLTQGCLQWDQPSCRNNRQTFVRRAGSFEHDAPGSSRLSIGPDKNSSHSPSDCREICWNDCECLAYFHVDGSDGCQFWSGINRKFVQSFDGTGRTMYIIITAPPAGNVLMKIILGVLCAFVVLSLGIIFFIQRKLKQGKMELALHQLLTLDGCTEDENGRGGTNQDLRPFTYSSIKSATNNFSSGNKLGQGGFGPVYKGKTLEGKDIAIKLLSKQSGQGYLEFKTELTLISKLQHVNLVKLIGFCIHKDDKMIIYDYMPNKSLDFFLFSPSDEGKLDWQKRFSIIEGIAQGLLYLHKYSRLKIIHRDLKPSNILLDQNMIPKISDFGLARIFKQDISEASTHRLLGTRGYMSPEYVTQGIISVKSDVYSFGVLLLEIVSGRKNNSFHDIEGPLSLVEYTWELWRRNCALELMDPTTRDSCVIGQLQRCIHIGLLCVENHAADRPTIEDVISMLKNEVTNLPMPNSPAFITRNNMISAPEKLSSNELTLSEIEGR